jgi:hypothetical protein
MHACRSLTTISVLSVATLWLGISAAAAGKQAAPGVKPTPPAVSWLKRLPGAYLDTAWSSLVTRDGNVVIGMQAMGKDDKPNVMSFAKLDMNGKLLWQQTLPPAPAGNGHQSCEIPMALREAADGNLLVAGTRCNHTLTTYYQSWPYAWYARLDARARVVWETAPDRGASMPTNQGMPQSYGWDIVEWPDGGILGLGLHTGGTGFAMWRLDMGADGSVKQQRADANMGFDEYWRGIWSAGVDGRGTRIGFSTLEQRGEARVGWLGRDLAFHDRASLTGPASEELHGLSATPDGAYCLVYKRDGNHVLRRHGTDDSLYWELQLPTEPTTRVLAMRGGGCLLAGGIESGAAGLRLARYDADGKPLWGQEIAGRLTPKSLQETPAGGLIVTGYETPADFRGSTAYVLHLAAPDLGRAGVKPARR